MHAEWGIRQPRRLSEKSRKPPRDHQDRFRCTEEQTPPSAPRPSVAQRARPGQRNTSAMMAAIKPNVASQLTVPINSSVMGQCPPCCQRRRLIQGKEQKEPVSKKKPRRRQRGSLSADRISDISAATVAARSGPAMNQSRCPPLPARRTHK